jgi:hypothetical protein
MNNGVATTTMDSIVRTVLVEMNLPIHSYFRAASIGIRTMRDLNLGTLPYVKTVRLTVDEFRECDIPSDLVDWIKVGVEKGKEIVPMGENKSYNRLPNLDDADAQISYDEPSGHTISINSSFNNYTFGRSVNDYGEINGKMFGLGNAHRADEFKFIPERSKILVGGNRSENDILYLEYVAYDKSQFYTGIPVVATPYIEQSIRFNFARYDRTGRLGDTNREQQILSNEKRKLRAALTKIDTDSMLRLFRSNYKQSIKA